MNHVIVFGILYWLLNVSFISQMHEEGNSPYLVVLGTAQDGGYPHAGCQKECCSHFYEGKEEKHFVSSLAVIDPESGERFLFDCTPDFPAQLHQLDSIFPADKIMNGIFLTHAHIGHYTGLVFLGRETMNANAINVYAMADMKKFLESNGPWSLLVTLQNIRINLMKNDSTIRLNDRIKVTPFGVPHRHEFTNAVGFKISTPGKSIVFIPDIDKWSVWDRDIVKMVRDNDLLFLDGTFFRNGEIPGRDMSEIPHPFIEETMKLFESLPQNEKSKIYFIHLNHTNPALLTNSEARKEIESKGFHVARDGQVLQL